MIVSIGRFLSFSKVFFPEFYARGCGGNTAVARLSEACGQGLPYRGHGIDDLIRGDAGRDARHCHLSRAKGVHCPGGVALDAGHFHQNIYRR